MDLRQLRHATVLAQTGSFVKAAEELSLTQPALSRSIQSLEEELGVRLFERGRQGAQLTREGRLLVERAEHVRLTLGSLRHDLALMNKGELGEVGFGLGPLVAAIFLANLLTELINAYPHIIVRSYVDNADVLRTALLDERIDFFVNSAWTLAPDAKLEVTPLGVLPLSLFVRTTHPLARKKNITPSDLAAFPIITGNAPQMFRSVGLHGEHPQSLDVNYSCDDFLTLKQVTQRTDAIWQTSRAVVIEECRRGKLIELRHANQLFPIAADLAITSLSGRSLSPTALLVVQLVRNLFERVHESINPPKA